MKKNASYDLIIENRKQQWKLISNAIDVKANKHEEKKEKRNKRIGCRKVVERSWNSFCFVWKAKE